MRTKYSDRNCHSDKQTACSLMISSSKLYKFPRSAPCFNSIPIIGSRRTCFGMSAMSMRPFVLPFLIRSLVFFFRPSNLICCSMETDFMLDVQVVWLFQIETIFIAVAGFAKIDNFL